MRRYWSFGEWNQRALRYSAVVYGAGEAFRSTGAALGQVLREVGGLQCPLPGRLGPKGIGIPLDFNGSVASGEPKVEPAMEWYEWLLSHGRRREGKVLFTTDHSESASHWLGKTLGEQLARLWQTKHWIPQEALGFEQLGAFLGGGAGTNG